MPTYYNRLSASELAKFLADHRTLTDSMIAELNKAKVDLNGFTSEQINHYKQALGIDTGETTAPSNPIAGQNPANPMNPPNPLAFGQPKNQAQIDADAAAVEKANRGAFGQQPSNWETSPGLNKTPMGGVSNPEPKVPTPAPPHRAPNAPSGPFPKK